MIYTSYFANIKKLPPHLKTISISRFPPKWYEGESDLLLAPSKELLLGIKDGNISEEEYTKEYLDYLNTLNPKEIEEKYKDSILLCYEKTGDFCHRHILTNWLNYNNVNCEEKTKLNIGILGSKNFDNLSFIKYKLGQLPIIHPNMKFNIITSNMIGVASLSNSWAKQHQIETEEIISDWDNHGKKALQIRNQEIINKADVIYIFWDGISPGTLESIKLAIESKKPLSVYIVDKHNINIEVINDYNLHTFDNTKLYIYGDNLTRKGKKNEDTYRNLPNSIGVVLKLKPTKSKKSFFSDQVEEIDIMKTDLRDIYKKGLGGQTICYPEQGLSEDLGLLYKYSPKTYKELDNISDILFGMKNISNEVENYI